MASMNRQAAAVKRANHLLVMHDVGEYPPAMRESQNHKLSAPWAMCQPMVDDGRCVRVIARDAAVLKAAAAPQDFPEKILSGTRRWGARISNGPRLSPADGTIRWIQLSLANQIAVVYGTSVIQRVV